MAAIQYHFRSRDGRIAAVISRVMEPLERDHRRELEALDPAASLDDVVRAWAAEAQLQAIALACRCAAGCHGSTPDTSSAEAPEISGVDNQPARPAVPMRWAKSETSLHLRSVLAG
jgi:AcrR family transcriptional regulator